MRRHEGGRRAIFPATIGWQKRNFMLHVFTWQNQELSLSASGDELRSESADGDEMRGLRPENFLICIRRNPLKSLDSEK
jgi:hypothetical protein